MNRLTLLFAVACLVLGLASPCHADDAEVERAIAAQDRELKEAARTGAMGRVVGRYMSMLSRKETALNVYLVGRALYYDQQPEEALRYMQRTLKIEPGFWNAERGLALLYMNGNKFDLALGHLESVRRRRPRDLELMRLEAQLRYLREEWPECKILIEAILAREPRNLDVRLLLVDLHSKSGDTEGVANELAVLVKAAPENQQFRLTYAGALTELEREKEAADQFERALRMDPENYAIFKSLEYCYYRSKNWKALKHTWQRMLPSAPNEKEKARLEEGLRVLEKGPPTDMRPEGWEEDPVTVLIERCLDPKDPEGRYKALVQYFDNQIPFVPLVLYSRLDPERESEARCRWMLLRILGQLDSLEAAPRIATALWDPAMAVRRVAADELGRYNSKAMLIYLQPYFMGLPIDTVPKDPDTRDQLESEYNAARESLRNVTAFRDLPVGESWVAAKDMAENRKLWETFFAGELGRRVMLDAIEAFRALKDPYPELNLIYRVLADPNIEIVRAAYDVMLAHADAAVTGEDPEMKERWVGFPRFDSKTITDESLKTFKDRIQNFFKERRRRLDR